jgi:hypothetical protein
MFPSGRCIIEVRMLVPTGRVRSCPVMVSGALATEMVFVTGIAAKAVEFSAALAVRVTDPPPRMIALVPLISMIWESLDV